MNGDKLTASEAVFGFVAWITTREGTVRVGSKHNSAPMVDAVGEFVEANGLSEPREGWEKRLRWPGVKDGLEATEA